MHFSFSLGLFQSAPAIWGCAGEIGILLPNNRRQHRALHIQKDVLPYALCYLLCPVSAACARKTDDDSIHVPSHLYFKNTHVHVLLG